MTCFREPEDVLRNQIKLLQRQVTLLQAEATKRVEERRRDYIFVGDLSEDGQEVIRRRVEKFRRGQQEHGPFSLDKYTLEQIVVMLAEEEIDRGHYAEMLAMKIERGKNG